MRSVCYFIFLIATFQLLSFQSSASQKLSSFLHKPKLVLVLVIDQFRSDYLPRFEKKFQPALKGNQVGGFNYLMNQGAYFPFAHYDIFQAMTCPGHSMILTGSYPVENGIMFNDWFDQETGQLTYCVSDNESGISPRRLKTTTVSDEWKNIDKAGKVVSISLKDRSAVMLGGHRADTVLWMNEKSLRWETSRYYGVEPSWVVKNNSKLEKLKGSQYDWKDLKRSISYDDRKVIETPYGNEATVDLSIEALENEKLGLKDNNTDFLFISFSAHDLAGHQYGPNSPEMESMSLSDDQQISRLLNEIKKRVGLENVVIVFTADHGVSPSAQYLADKKIKSKEIDYLDLFKKLNSTLDEQFGKPKNGPWINAVRYFNFFINHKVLNEKKLNAEVVSQVMKKVIQQEPYEPIVYTKGEIARGLIIPSFWAEALSHQFDLSKGGDVFFMPEPFHYEKTKVSVTHMTGYNYDTRVPLILVGSAFKPGVYGENAKVVDIAPTLSFVLNILSPPKARGRVLHEALKSN